jgi:hypothetical protein
VVHLTFSVSQASGRRRHFIITATGDLLLRRFSELISDNPINSPNIFVTPYASDTNCNMPTYANFHVAQNHISYCVRNRNHTDTHRFDLFHPNSRHIHRLQLRVTGGASIVNCTTRRDSFKDRYQIFRESVAFIFFSELEDNTSL